MGSGGAALSRDAPSSEAGNKQLDGRAATELTVHLDGALVAAHDAEHCGQAQAATGKLGGEERIEDLSLRRRAHAATVIVDFYEHVFALGELGRKERAAQVVPLRVQHARWRCRSRRLAHRAPRRR